MAEAVDDLQVLPGQARVALQAEHQDAELGVHTRHVVRVRDVVHAVLQARAPYEALRALGR